MGNLKISQQLFLLVCGIMIAFASVTSYLIHSSVNAIYAERFDMLRTQVESGLSILAYYKEKEDSGEMTTEEAQAQAFRLLSHVRYEPAGYLIGFDYDVVQRFHPSSANIGKNLSGLVDENGLHYSADMVEKGKAGGGITIFRWSRPGQPADRMFLKGAYSKAFEPWKLVISSGVYMDDLQATISHTIWKVVGIGLTIALLAIAAAFFVIRNITRPLIAVHDALRAVSNEDLETRIPHTSKSNEIGLMAKATLALQKKVSERRDLALREQEQQAELDRERQSNAERQAEDKMAEERAVSTIGDALAELATGNLTARCGDLGPRYQALRTNFNEALTQLETAMASVNAKCAHIESSKEEIRRASNDLSHRTERQAASLEETAAALDQFTVAVRQTAEGARNAADRVASVSAEATRSDEIVAEAIKAMGTIEESADSITKIIGIIDDIAFQTNLLALNAGVEAARAGESGKGFAVVAQEVRELAQRSAAAAREIKTQISRSSEQVHSGVQLVSEAGEALKRISSQIQSASDLVGRISRSASEQDLSLSSIASSLNQLDAVTQRNAAMAEETTASAEALAADTDQLLGLISAFQISEGGEQTHMHHQATWQMRRAG